MTWIKKAEPKPIHKCEPPMRPVKYKAPAGSPMAGQMIKSSYPEPDGSVGDVWQCDECLELWRITTMAHYTTYYSSYMRPQWQRAPLWVVLRVMWNQRKGNKR